MTEAAITVAVISDLHLEYERQPGDEPPQSEVGPDWSAIAAGSVDLVLLPGDIDAGPHAANAVAYAAHVADLVDAPVAMVAGNHEFYRRERREVLADLRRAAERCGRPVYVLDNDVLVIATRRGPLRLLGCTLWTDFWLFDDPAAAMAAAAAGINDFRLILEGGIPLTPQRAADLHRESRAWLAERFADPFDGATIVMTHHAPSPQSVPQRFRNDQFSAAFASDMEALIELWQPALWVHGHMHDPVNYRIGGTRVVCNPRGYVGVESGAATAVPQLVKVTAPDLPPEADPFRVLRTGSRSPS